MKTVGLILSQSGRSGGNDYRAFVKSESPEHAQSNGAERKKILG
jgi:hypothetical protein